MLAQANELEGLTSTGAILGILLALLVILPLGLLIGAIIHRAAAAWVTKIHVPMGSAMLTVFLCHVANLAVGFAIGGVVGVLLAEMDERTLNLVIKLAALPFGLLAQGAIVGARLKVGLGWGTLVVLAQLAIVLAIALCVGAFVIGLIVAFR